MVSQSEGQSLAEAQLRKLDALIEMAQLKANDNVLEIGFGWGSMAMRAVQVCSLPCQQHQPVTSLK